MAKLALGFVLLAAACGPSSRNGTGDDDDTKIDAPGTTGDGPHGNDIDAGACATSSVKADKTPLDIFIMLDHSASMQDGSKWTNVTSAINSFVGQGSLAGVKVGLQYFGVPPTTAPPTCSVAQCTADADCGTGCGPCMQPIPGFGICSGFGAGLSNDSCVAADYATAAVAMAALPGNASAITSSINAKMPDGDSTPTEPALAGALQYSKAYAQAHAGDQVVVVFATDGVPTGCSGTNTIAQAETDAKNAYMGAPKIPTYVIGVGTDAPSDLNGIAMAGGSGMAFFVDQGATAQQQFLMAMNTIQHAALGCQYTIPTPTSGTPNFGEVNVTYTMGGTTTAVTIPQVPNAAACPTNQDAWYYDNPNAPTQILLCNSTCTKVEADTTGEVDVALGCSTIIF